MHAKLWVIVSSWRILLIIFKFFFSVTIILSVHRWRLNNQLRSTVLYAIKVNEVKHIPAKNNYARLSADYFSAKINFVANGIVSVKKDAKCVSEWQTMLDHRSPRRGTFIFYSSSKYLQSINTGSLIPVNMEGRSTQTLKRNQNGEQTPNKCTEGSRISNFHSVLISLKVLRDSTLCF